MRLKMIDRKFKFVAVNPCNKKVYTEADAVVFCAKDKALIPALLAYAKECERLGANEEHIQSVRLLIQRVDVFQTEIECRVPDTIGNCEIDRCVGGIGI
jgi:hypothetical protein